MEGQLLKSRFSLIMAFCLGSLLTSLIWYNCNVEPQRLLPKKTRSQLSEPCEGCTEVLDKVAERNTETSKKQEDKPETIREGNDKTIKQHSKISNKQKDNPQKVKEGNDKTIKQQSKISKKQKDNVKKVKKENKKVEDLHPQNSNTEEDESQKIREVIHKAVEHYSQTWKKQEDNYQKFRSKLSNKCNGLNKAIITQNHKPVGSEIFYETGKKPLQVTSELFSIFIKDQPFSNKTLDTCAVVGNGGILTNSSCGEIINSAQFVIRCNLPPLGNGYEKHVGIKTDLVTANPSIFLKKYRGLHRHPRPLVEGLRSYGNSLLLLPAFYASIDTAASLRAINVINEFKSPIRPVFLNPEYLKSLRLFWRSQGLRERRLSTGLITTSLALELCNNVHLYGFWPFSNHPHDFHNLTNHYYDDMQAKNGVHVMSDEFDFLMKLHSQGVLRLHLGHCPTSGK